MVINKEDAKKDIKLILCLYSNLAQDNIKNLNDKNSEMNYQLLKRCLDWISNKISMFAEKTKNIEFKEFFISQNNEWVLKEEITTALKDNENVEKYLSKIRNFYSHDSNYKGKNSSKTNKEFLEEFNNKLEWKFLKKIVGRFLPPYSEIEAELFHLIFISMFLKRFDFKTLLNHLKNIDQKIYEQTINSGIRILAFGFNKENINKEHEIDYSFFNLVEKALQKNYISKKRLVKSAVILLNKICENNEINIKFYNLFDIYLENHLPKDKILSEWKKENKDAFNFKNKFSWNYILYINYKANGKRGDSFSITKYKLLNYKNLIKLINLINNDPNIKIQSVIQKHGSKLDEKSYNPKNSSYNSFLGKFNPSKFNENITNPKMSLKTLNKITYYERGLSGDSDDVARGRCFGRIRFGKLLHYLKNNMREELESDINLMKGGESKIKASLKIDFDKNKDWPSIKIVNDFIYTYFKEGGENRFEEIFHPRKSGEKIDSFPLQKIGEVSGEKKLTKNYREIFGDKKDKKTKIIRLLLPHIFLFKTYLDSEEKNDNLEIINITGIEGLFKEIRNNKKILEVIGHNIRVGKATKEIINKSDDMNHIESNLHIYSSLLYNNLEKILKTTEQQKDYNVSSRIKKLKTYLSNELRFIEKVFGFDHEEKNLSQSKKKEKDFRDIVMHRMGVTVICKDNLKKFIDEYFDI